MMNIGSTPPPSYDGYETSPEPAPAPAPTRSGEFTILPNTPGPDAATLRWNSLIETARSHPGQWIVVPADMRAAVEMHPMFSTYEIWATKASAAGYVICYDVDYPKREARQQARRKAFHDFVTLKWVKR